MELAVRGDADVATLRFLAVIPPNALLECCRVNMTVSHLKRMLDVIAQSLKYYPAAPGADQPPIS